jgi:hypothetical protein
MLTLRLISCRDRDKATKLQIEGIIIIIIVSGVGLSPLGTTATFGLLYKPQMIDDWWLWSN